MAYRRRNTRTKRRKTRTKARQRGGQSPTVSFISYGNDKFKSAKDRIKKEAEQMGIFNGNIRIYGPEDLSPEFKATVGPTLEEPRGGGYWLWKPYIINDMLNKLNEGDILLYVDAGCILQPAGVPRLKEYIGMISKESGKSVLAMRLEFPEYQWTSANIFDHFDIQPQNERAKSTQILTGTSMYRKCKESMALVSAWLKMAMEHPELFTDKHNQEKQAKREGFIQNRHDQSIFSILVKSPPHNATVAVIDEEIEGRNKTIPVDKIPILAARKKD